MSDGIKRFPPNFDSSKKHPRQYDLENIDVYLDSQPGEYFSINGLPANISYGKHAFTIYVTEPNGQSPLKNFSNVLFEVKDSAGTLIWSSTTNVKDLSGASVCYLWVKEDPISTIKNIQDGPATLTIVGQLQDVPAQYQNVYNVRTIFPLNIRTDFLNNSPILFQSSSKIADNITITESLEADIDNPNFNKSYANITLNNLETFGGEVETIQVSYLESGSLSVLEDEEFTLLTQQRINKISGSFENEIDFRLAKGINPNNQSFRVVMPPMANQSGSNFGLNANKFKFKFEFLNKNNEKATDYSSGQDLNITSSFVNFVGPATIIGGEGNLIDGQLFLGNTAISPAIEMSAQNSAFIRSIGYLGFTSASAGSGSGFMLYSGSVLAANTDDYQQGGVGFEFVSSSEAFMKFSTNPSIFDVRAKTFFVGSETTQFISGSGQNIEISSSKFHLTPDGQVTMSGQLAVEAGGTIGGFTISDDALSTTAFILSSSQNLTDPVSFISSSRFKVGAAGQVTASNIFIEGAIITGSTEINIDNDIRVKGVKVAAIGASDVIELGDSSAIISGSSLSSSIATLTDVTYGTLSGSTISASDARFNGNVVIDGSVTADTFITNVIEENFSTGNTIFGNSNDDIHRFTGSLIVAHTGSNNIGLLLTGSSMRVMGDISASGDLVLDGEIINDITASGLGFFGGSIGVNGVSQSLSTFTTYPGLYVKQSDTDGGPLGSKNILIGGGSDIAPSNAKLKMYLDDDYNGVLTTYQFGSSLKLKAGVSSSVYPHNWSQILIKDTGTSTSAPDGFIQFWTSGSQRAVIDEDGKLGIGTTSPLTQLHIQESAVTNFDQDNFANLIIEDDDARMQIVSNDGGNNGSALILTNVDTSDGTHRNWAIGTATSAQNNIFHIGYNESKSDVSTYTAADVVIDKTGKVGIGNSSPTKELVVSGDISASGKGFFGDDLRITDGARSLTYDVSGNSLALNGSDSIITAGAYNLKFLANTDGVSSTTNAFTFSTGSDAVPLMVMRTDGRVGIGTDSPYTELDLVGTASFGDTTDGLMIYRKGDVGYIEGIDKDRTGFNAIQIGANGSTTQPNLHLTTDTKVGIKKNNPAFTLDVAGDIASSANITSPSFTSGFVGSGFRIEIDDDSKYTFTVDNLTVRDKMNVFEMLIHQVRATNGSLFVSNTGKIISSSIVNASDKSFKLFFDTGSGYGHSFRPGDVIRAQRFAPSTNGSGSTDGLGAFKSDLVIESVTGITESIARLTGSVDSTDAPTAGYEYVRIGNIDDESDRQGSIYLTADDDNAPFIDVADGIKTHAGFNTTGTVKTRMGKLSGITSDKFGTLTGYGFYSSGSAFLEGTINADKGLVGGWALSDSVISSSNITIDSSNQKITIQSTTFGQAGVQLEFDGSSNKGKLYAGDGSNKFIKFDGTRATIKSDNFELDSSGNITATNADLSGKLTSTEGQIGGFGLGATALTSSNFTLSASSATNELFISHSNFKVKNTGQITGSALLLTGSANTNFLQFNNGVLTIRGDVAATTISTPSASIDAQGFLTATSGSIGGFDITSDRITGGAVFLDSDSNNGIIAAGATNLATGTGFYVDGNGNFRAGVPGGSSEIKFNSGDSKLSITSSNVSLSGSDINITTENLTASGSNVVIETPSFFLGENQSTFVSGANGNLEITSSQFHLDVDGNASFGGDIQVGSQATLTNLNDGLILHYNFDQYSFEQQPGPRFPLRNNVEEFSDMTADISFGIGSGSIETSTGSNAIVNTGLFFSGSDRTKTIVLDHDTINSDMIDTNNYSLSFFFKPVNVGRAGNPPQQIFGAGGSSNGFNAFITQSKIITNFYETPGKGSVTSASISDNNMHHVVATYNSGEAKLYLNGELKQTDNIDVGTITGFSGKIHIGGFSSNQEYYMSSGSAPITFNGTLQVYEGYLDEVRLYKGKVLTQNEVRAIFLNPQASVASFVNGGQIKAGVIKSLNSSATEGTILNLQEGELHAGGSGSNARFLFDGEQLRVSASAFFVGSESFISGSGANIEISSSGFHLKPEGDAIFSGSITANDGEIGGFTITDKLTGGGGVIELDPSNRHILVGSSDNIVKMDASEGLFAGAATRDNDTPFQAKVSGQVTGSNVLFTGGKIGGFTLTETELSIDNIKLSSVEKGLVISSSQGVGKVIISSGSLSPTTGTSNNLFDNSSFETIATDTIITASSPVILNHWYFENDTATGAVTEELWNSGSISMSISDSDAGAGSKHIRISVSRELGPAGTGQDQIPT